MVRTIGCYVVSAHRLGQRAMERCPSFDAEQCALRCTEGSGAVAGGQKLQPFYAGLRACLVQTSWRSGFSPGQNRRSANDTQRCARALRHLGRRVVRYADIETKDTSLFTMHSLKCTMLPWGNQLHLGKPLRAAQGHDRLATVPGTIQKHGRDNVVGQLKFQTLLQRWCVRAGSRWFRCTGVSLHRVSLVWLSVICQASLGRSQQLILNQL